MLKILIAEDEEPIANLIRVNLKKAGYECICAYDGEEAANLMEEGHYDFITAMGTTNHKVTGLKMGAEDYITKPFEIVELLARVEAVLRRYHKIGKIIKVLDVEIDLSSRIVLQNGQQVLLTLKEYELLLFFVRNPNIALYREVIYEQVWEKEYTGDSRTVDLHVQRLKKKLGWEGHICAIYKIGYRLETSL